MKVRLRTGIAVDHAISEIEVIASNAHGAATALGEEHPSTVQERYVRWSVSAERQLLLVLDRVEVERIFANARHRDLCSMAVGNQINNLVNAEIASKHVELTAIVDSLKETRNRLRSGTGYPAILDTNVLMQCLRPDQIDWNLVVGENDVRLMLPLRVIEELDTKKYAGTDRQRRVARNVLPWLDQLLAGNILGPVSARGPGNTTIEVMPIDRPRWRPSDADEEILEAFQEVRQFTGRGKLITADTGMRMRARAEGIDILSVPDRYLRPTDPGTDAPPSRSFPDPLSIVGQIAQIFRSRCNWRSRS